MANKYEYRLRGTPVESRAFCSYQSHIWPPQSVLGLSLSAILDYLLFVELDFGVRLLAINQVLFEIFVRLSLPTSAFAESIVMKIGE